MKQMNGPSLKSKRLGTGSRLKEESIIFGASSITTTKVAAGYVLRILQLATVCFLKQTPFLKIDFERFIENPMILIFK